jgi:hypothetical protein
MNPFPNIKYLRFDIGDTLERRGTRYEVAGSRPGYYILRLKTGSELQQLNSSFVEMGFTRVATFEEELDEL